MDKLRQDAVIIPAKSGFNYNKLQATACITCSVAVSIAAIYWAITTFF